MRALLVAIPFAAATAMLLPMNGEASQTGRRAKPCNVADARTVDDQEVVQLGTDFQPGRRRTGEKLQIGGNVTDIVWVMNHTDCPITLSKHDWGVFGTNGEIIEVPPRGSYQGHMWVPWRTDPYGLAISLDIKGRPYFAIWQMAGRLAFLSQAGFEKANAVSPDAYRAGYGRSPSVPGLSVEGGPRILHVATSADGKPFFKFEGVAEE